MGVTRHLSFIPAHGLLPFPSAGPILECTAKRGHKHTQTFVSWTGKAECDFCEIANTHEWVRFSFDWHQSKARTIFLFFPFFQFFELDPFVVAWKNMTRDGWNGMSNGHYLSIHINCQRAEMERWLKDTNNAFCHVLRLSTCWWPIPWSWQLWLRPAWRRWASWRVVHPPVPPADEWRLSPWRESVGAGAASLAFHPFRVRAIAIPSTVVPWSSTAIDNTSRENKN